MLHSLFFHDEEYSRVDILPWIANTITAICTLLIAVVLPDVANVALLLIFAFGMRALLSMLAASNIAATVISLAAVVVVAPLNTTALLAVVMYVATFILLFEFLKNTNLKIGLVLGVVTGMLAALQGDYGAALLLLVVGISSAYVIWRLFFGRPSKKVFIKMVAKTLLSAILAAAGYMLIAPFVRNAMPTFGLSVDVVVINPVLLGVALALALYGLWATVLLKTARSPHYRGVRLFLLVEIIGILSLCWLVQQYGNEVLSSQFLYLIATLGLSGWSLPLFCVSMFVLGLFASSGLERPLFKRSLPADKRRAI